MLSCLWRVVAWVATYVRHQHLDTLHLEERELVVHTADNSAIDISVHAPKRLERRNLVGKLQRAKVASMPYLVAGR